jgi:hypothetical protein
LVAYPLPAIWRTEGAEQGGLIGYGPRNDAVFRQCALQVAKLLRGATVADMPVEQPTKFELGINAKCQGAKHRDPSVDSCACRSGDRITTLLVAVHESVVVTKRECRNAPSISEAGVDRLCHPLAGHTRP